MPNKILVIRLSSLGDVVLTAPIYRSLKNHWPDCHITVLVKQSYASVLEGNPAIDRVLPWSGLIQTLWQLRQEKFTHLLDLHANLRSRLIRLFTGIANISIYKKDAFARRIFVNFGVRTPVLERHTVERYMDALSLWGVPASAATIALEDIQSSSTHEAVSKGRILIIQNAFLGDSLLTLPLIRDLKKLYPSAHIAVLTLSSNAEIFKRSLWVNEVITDDKRGLHSGLFGLLRISAKIKRMRFDIAIVPHRSFRSALLSRLCGIPRRIGFTTSAAHWLYTDAVPFTWLMHDMERNLALLKALSRVKNTPSEESVYLDCEPQQRAAIKMKIIESGITKNQKIIGIHPGSAWPTKRWLEHRYSDIAQRFISQGHAVILLAGNDERDICGNISKHSGALDWSGKTSLLELKALMKELSLFITNDSGPMHLAAGSGVPTLALFGPTTKELGFFPYGPNHRVIESDLPCRPCGLHGNKNCPRGHFLCMGLITVDQVWQQAQEMLL